MGPIPDYGDLMTVKEFMECCEQGLFIDYDGCGYYSDGKEMSNIKIWPSLYKKSGITAGWSHVVWFNR
jgi:hypothetical protein